MKFVFQHWRDKLFKLTHALILPLSALIIFGLIKAISDVLIAANLKHQFVISLGDIGQSLINYVPLLLGASVVFYFVKLNKVYALFSYVLALGVFFATQSALIKVNQPDNVVDVFGLHNQEYFRFFVTSQWKFATLNSSYFGVFIVAIITIWTINHCSDFELNKKFSIINKEKFVPVILIPIMLITSLLMVIIWPYLGQGLSWLLMKTTNLSYGFDMFFYGLFKALLKPLGFDYIFSELVLETAVGGKFRLEDFFIIIDNLKIDDTKEVLILSEIFNIFTNNNKFISGQKNIFNFINFLNFNNLPINNQGDYLSTFKWFNNYLNINIGQFTQNYSLTFGLYSGIVAALIFASPSEKRKQTMKILIPSLLIAFLTGIDHLLIFILLFSTPLLYFVLYIPFTGLTLMLMKVFDAHLLGNVNQGLFDFINYAIISFSKGSRFWVVIPIAFCQLIAAFLIVCLLTKRINWNKLAHSEHNAMYISKNYYKNLLNIGFKNHFDDSNHDLSIKQKLQNYVIKNLKNQKWKSGDLIPSEKALAIKFNCSRHTVRNALLKYVESGILTVKKGQGYFVTNNNFNIFVNPNDQNLDFHRQSLKIISQNNFDFKASWIEQDNYDLNNLNLSRTYNLEKKSFDSKDSLVIYEILIINRSEIFLSNNAVVIDYQMLQLLNLQHKTLTQSYSQVIFIKGSQYQNIARELGWKHEFPLIVSIFTNNHNWIEISIKLISRQQWKFSRNYKIIS